MVLNLQLHLEFNATQMIQIVESPSLMEILGQLYATQVRKNFDLGGRDMFGGVGTWEPSIRVIIEGGRTLINTGWLVNSISPDGAPKLGKGKSGPGGISYKRGEVSIGTNVKYAKKLAEGYGKLPARPMFDIPEKANENIMKLFALACKRELKL